ncbi:hypothetical protein RN001_004182 [Aquatica leii]|uniref:C2 domain-containing protein n=1 Tax=Aquatica leii TaxID=1421715 RepID=A0AAN7QJD6_9COLE|nr:hypothetical protein RN001_004182 [Aquatica leii]
MSLLSVTVKKARYVGAQASQFNTYVTLKLQNVKSTTVTVKGATPCWEQDFLFETNDVNTGLLIEVWSKGMIWDRAMGYNWVPLQTVQYANEEGSGQWLSLDAELVMRDGEVVGTKSPTGHSLLVDCRFELPFDPENAEAGELQRKLEMLNNIMDQEAPRSASNQFENEISAGYSEDSDYTSDLNYPVGQHANSSASQFRTAAHQMHTPQRSLETSRENSYERDDIPGQQHHLSTPYTHQQHLSPSHYQRYHTSLNQRYSPNTDEYGYNSSTVETQQLQDFNIDSDPLFYNSRPPSYYKPDYPRRQKYTWENETSQTSWGGCNNYNYNQQNLDRVDADFIEDPYYYNTETSPRKQKEVERYIGACLITLQSRSKGNFKLNGRECSTTHRKDFLPRYVNNHQHPQRYRSIDGWAGGIPLIFYANYQRRGNKVQPFIRIQDHYPLSHLAVHTQGAPLILTNKYNYRKNKSNVLDKNVTKTRNVSVNCNPKDSNARGVDAVSVNSDESSASTNSENCLPRIIKPRKRRKKDRKPMHLVHPLGSEDCFSTDSASPDIDSYENLNANLGVPFTFELNVPDIKTFHNESATNTSTKKLQNYIMRLKMSKTSQSFNQSYEEYFDASSYVSQEDRYGQDQEDRQWDSGGYNRKNTSKKLPTVPVVQNYLNKKRSSIIAQEIYQSCDGYLSSPTPKTRRRMPQIPAKRSASRQSSINDQELYDGYGTPENTSHRGASLPPTPTKTTKVLARIAANTKSLPPTPGRKLPQPNLTNHRSAKSKRNNLMKRTNSAEYPDYSNEDIYENAYIRQGAISAREVYNEDYNYAYQSIDNLPTDQQEELTSAIDSDYRSSVAVKVSENGAFPSYQQSTEEYYFSAQEERDYSTEQDYYETKLKEPVHKRKLLRGRVKSPLVQQNTDSLESRDDDLKDSFETAASSLSSSMHPQRRVPIFDPYTSVTPEIIVHNTTVIPSPSSGENSLQASCVSVQYRRDQPEPVKAISTLNSTNTTVPDVTITEPNSTVNQTIPFRNGSSRGYLVQQETIDSTCLQHQESIDDDIIFHPVERIEIVYPEKITEEPYLEQQESIESYVEEDMHDISADYTKAINRESPASVIHVAEDDVSLRRGSSQITVVDPFHPSLQHQRPLEPYAPISSRRPSIDPFRAPSPIGRSSGETYQSASSLKTTDDLYNQQRKNSIDPYQQGAPRRASVRHSPAQLEYEEHEENHALDEDLETKHVHLKEDIEIKPVRPQVTAQQRWHWAYNKIIMQLNVVIMLSLSRFIHLQKSRVK